QPRAVRDTLAERLVGTGGPVRSGLREHLRTVAGLGRGWDIDDNRPNEDHRLTVTPLTTKFTFTGYEITSQP
ncbi:hypothetical protein ABZ943_37050, partial [Streptomyces rubiginosohelvolus]|uniref:hypothetical protein n=1 Tax=Streptomyces rubiginosohelvolus TaxID=67362 RepID=UPI0033E4DD06